MPQINYVDLHCDTLTECADRCGNLKTADLQTNFKKLKNSFCAAQCFAIFTQGDGAALKFEKYLAYYKTELEQNADFVAPINEFADIAHCQKEEKLGCILTVENLGFIGKDLSKLNRLKSEGVKMASLVWNYQNALAYPNVIFEHGIPQIEKREERGLTELGKETVEILDGLKIIVDISHLSDGGAEEILNGRKIPVVASHSNALSICMNARNLTDGLIKKISDCGGVMGVNFCKKFLGNGGAFERVYDNLNYLVNVGGEDCVALGSDFDGIPPCQGLEDCTRVPKLLEYLLSRGIKEKTLQKFAIGNFLRVFKEVCG